MYHVIGKTLPNEHNIAKNYVFGPFETEKEASDYAFDHLDPYRVMHVVKTELLVMNNYGKPPKTA